VLHSVVLLHSFRSHRPLLSIVNLHYGAALYGGHERTLLDRPLVIPIDGPTTAPVIIASARRPRLPLIRNAALGF
jgi:hypothetical protein